MPVKKSEFSTIVAFTQHGFNPEGTSGEQAYGRCPFCGSGRKSSFYVHMVNHMWDCKICKKEGGYQTFLREISNLARENFKGTPAIELSKNRGIKLSTLREAGVGFNPNNRTYLIPVIDANNEKIWDIRIYGNKGLKSTSGCKVGLFNWEKINQKIETVWICEGEWDSMVMNEVIRDLQIPNSIAVAVPGAGTFKAEWIMMFEGKHIVVPYDFDDAGFEGSRKVYNNLNQIAASMKFLHWPDDSSKGWDLRDQYNSQKRNAKEFLDFISQRMLSTPPGIDPIDTTDFGTNVKVSTSTLNGRRVSASEVYDRFTKWLKLPTTDVLDIMFGTAIANRLPGDPLWLFLVAPSGATKTELIMSMMTAPKVISTTTLTAPALISGANVAGGNDPSLLRIMNEKLLLIKDFTTILSMNSLVREEIFGILRDAYDGRIEKRFGNGVYRLYDPCRFGIIAGVTPAVELYTEEHVALGERFLRFKVPLDQNWANQREILRMAVSNTTHEEKMRSDLQEIGKEVLSHDYQNPPTIPDYIIEKLLCLAQWTTILRSTIVRDKYSKEVTHKPIGELATRVSKQYCKLLLGIGMFRGLEEVGEEEYQLVKSIAIGTVPTRMEDVLSVIYRRNSTGNWDAREIAEILNLPHTTTGRIIENMMMLKVFRKEPITQTKFNWSLTDEFIDLIERASIY